MTRNHALDSLRGLAALAVALGHCNLQVTGLEAWGARLADFPRLDAGTILARLAYVAFPSDAAVMLFFVLSGHVLWQACGRHVGAGHSGTGYPGGALAGLPDWILARLYRLLPVAMVCAIPLGLLQDASAARLVGNMLLLRHDLNGPAWSLQVEMVASLALFPLYCLVRGRPVGVAVAIGLLVALLPWLRGNAIAPYLPVFLAGALIGAVPAGWWRRWLLAPGLAGLLLGSLVLGHGQAGRLAEALGAVAVVGTFGPWQPAWLLHPVLRFLGRVSYPFYLSHTLGLALAAPLVAALGPVGPAAQVLAFAVLSLAITLPIAWTLHHAVEMPLMQARPRLRPAAARRQLA